MENQHRKIKGYTELNQTQIELMNKIKEKGIELGELIEEVNAYNLNNTENYNEPIYWVAEGELTLKKGLMFLTRGVANPTFF